MESREITKILEEANEALIIARDRIQELETKLAFYASPNTWQRNSFRLATSIPEDVGDIAAYDPKEKCKYLIGGKLAREYFLKRAGEDGK